MNNYKNFTIGQKVTVKKPDKYYDNKGIVT